MITFDTVAKLKLSSLTAGQLVKTKGYTTVGDGGGAEYSVVVNQAVDELGDHTLANNNVALLQGVGGLYRTFETVTEMVASTGLRVGNLVRTLGYVTVGDGGGNEYEIVAAATGTDDGGSYINLNTLQARGLFPSDWVWTKQFGAIADDTTDAYAAINAAGIYADAIGVPLLLSPGAYSLSAKISLSSARAIIWVGCGDEVTVLTWTATATGGGGLDLTYTDVRLPAKVRGITLKTRALATGEALKISGPESASVTHIGPVVLDVSAEGFDTATDSWDVGIHFYTCWYAVLQRVSIKGQDDATSPFAQTAGLKLTSCQVVKFSEFYIWHVETGVLEAASGVATHGEGFDLSSFEIVGVTTGISFTADANAPGTNIGPGHINAYETGIDLANQYQTSIHDMLLYKTHVSTSNYVAINMVDCNACHVHDNQLEGSATATGNTLGVVLTGSTASDDNNIHDISFSDFYGTTRVGVLVGTGAGNNHIHDNSGDPTVTTTILVAADAEKSNRFHHNSPEVVATFDANDATPSVGNALGQHFNTANSSATTVTALDDGYVGQIVSILVNDANTTFQHNGTGFVLQGSANFVAGNGAIITFRQDVAGGLWREMSRRTA